MPASLQRQDNSEALKLDAWDYNLLPPLMEVTPTLWASVFSPLDELQLPIKTQSVATVNVKKG